MPRLLVFVILCILAALAAAAFGALHNQLSFTVGPDYFHHIKFPQFGIENLPARVGAAWVGIQASWWMGPMIGLPAFVYGLAAIPPPRPFLAAGLRAIARVILLTALAALLGLAAALYLGPHPQLLAAVRIPEGADVTEILRAGLMHDASYLGGALGALAAFGPMRRAARRERSADAA